MDERHCDRHAEEGPTRDGSRARRLHVAMGGSRSANVSIVEGMDFVSKREGVSKCVSE